MPANVSPPSIPTARAVASLSVTARGWGRGGKSLLLSLTTGANGGHAISGARPPLSGTTGHLLLPPPLLTRGRCSISTSLLLDAQRDLADLGRPDIAVHALHKLPYGELPPEIDDGVMFCTYQSLIAKNKQAESRLDQLVQWAAAMSDDDPEIFDGCLVFDEAHRAKNLVPQKGPDVGGGGGGARGSKTAEAVLAIQRLLPHARVLYVSATAAAETKDLGYMVRLGLWGKGCPFPDFSQFAHGIQRAGVGAMELVAMDMKVLARPLPIPLPPHYPTHH